MRDLAIFFVQLLTTIARLIGPGGARAVVAESLLLKQQLIVANRSRQRARISARSIGLFPAFLYA